MRSEISPFWNRFDRRNFACDLVQLLSRQACEIDKKDDRMRSIPTDGATIADRQVRFPLLE
jgi:hypothetical protein